MSTIALAPRQVAASRVAAASTRVASALSDTADVAWRNLLTQLDGQIALVTGSTRGMGAGIAAEFARRGAAPAGPFGIRVNCITPETILTEGNQDRIPAELQASLADAHPLKRLGAPQDVATAAAFLASDDAA
jgi:NAD(P)-dependent dehydrogenase (short-subunit alcohol dehydrogenase family)